MNEQNLNNVIVIDRVSKKVLNEPQIEIDEEVYAEAVSRLVEKLLVGLRQGKSIKRMTPRSVFSHQSQKKNKLKNFQVCAGLMKKFVVCVCDERYSKNRKTNYRRKDEENCNLC